MRGTCVAQHAPLKLSLQPQLNLHPDVTGLDSVLRIDLLVAAACRNRSGAEPLLPSP